MAEIINLNRARKTRAKVEDKTRAAANRAAHGRTKAQKQSADKDRDRVARQLDGHKLDD
ncbi:MAG: DUF4169 family protein [Brevundimonas sp.]